MTTRSVLALQQELKQTKAVLAARRSQRSIASLANRVLIETAQYSAGGEGGRQLNRADHGQLLARVELLITMAHHHDAIAYGFLKPEVRVNPRRDIEVGEGFYKSVMQRYFSHRSAKSAEQAVKLYDSYFDRSKRSDGAAPEKDVIEFDEAFQGEFGFSVRQLFQINELWRKFAIESGALAGVLEERQTLGLLEKSAEMNCEQGRVNEGQEQEDGEPY